MAKHTQTIRRQFAFDHFVNLAFNGLRPLTDVNMKFWAKCEFFILFTTH